jgi:hypothetical protein
VLLRVVQRAEPEEADLRAAEVPQAEQPAAVQQAAQQAEPLVALGASANGRDRPGDPGIRSG